MKPHVLFWEPEEGGPGVLEVARRVKQMYVEDINPLTRIINDHIKKKSPTFEEQKEFEYHITKFHNKYIVHKR